MKYILNPTTQELDKISDIEATADKKEADKLARESGWKSDAELTNYLANQPSAAESKGAWKKFVEQRKREDKIDEEIINFGKDFQPHKKKINSKREPSEWVMHIAALHGGDESPKYKKHLIEDVQIQPNGEMRGMLTEKIYNAKEAIKMNEKYDRNFTNPSLSEDKQTYLTANEKVLANFNPTEALTYTDGGKDKENVQYMRYVKAKANRIKKSAKNKDKKSVNYLSDNYSFAENFKKQHKNINNKILTATNEVPVKEIDLGSDSELLEIMEWLKSHPTKSYQDWLDNNTWLKDNFGKLKKKPKNKNQDYKIKLPRDPIERNFTAMVLQSALEKENETNGGIGHFFPRVNLAVGGNGSTSSYDKKHTYQKQIEDLYGIQLTGQETIAELLEMMRKLNAEN